MIKKVKLLLVSLFSLHLLVWLVELMPFNLNTDVKFPIFIYLEIILACVLIGEQIFLFCQEVDRKTREFQEHPWNSLKKYFFEKINSWKEKYRLFKKNKLSRIRVQKIIFCLKQNIINNVLTPISLLIFGIIFSIYVIVFNSEYPSLLVLPSNLTLNEYTLTSKLKNKGEFVSKEDNLGIISVQFLNYDKKGLSLLFKIKKSDQKDWIIKNTYDIEQLDRNGVLFIGFPIEQNSRNKKFEFEFLEQSSEKFELNDKVPIYCYYKFPKIDSSKNFIIFLRFLLIKISRNIFNFNNTLFYLYAFTPIYLYLSLNTVRKYIKNADFYMFFAMNLIVFLLTNSLFEIAKIISNQTLHFKNFHILTIAINLITSILIFSNDEGNNDKT